jgi:hypothetical protein
VQHFSSATPPHFSTAVHSAQLLARVQPEAAKIGINVLAVEVKDVVLPKASPAIFALLELGSRFSLSIGGQATATLVGGGIGAVIGSFVGPEGTAAGAIIGGVAGNIGYSFFEDDIQNALINPAGNYIGGLLYNSAPNLFQ